jgi:hypothetical protein
MAIIRAKVRLGAALLFSFPVGAAMLLAGARPGTTTHFQATDAPQMERLIVALAGEWTTEDSYEASDGASKPRVEHARENYRAGPNRLSLIQEYHGEVSAGQPWATGTFWWDRKARGVRVLWCDSDAVDSGCRVLSGIGKWQGNDFVLTDVKGPSGKQVFSREVWSDLKPDSFTQTIYQGAAADKLEKILTIRATRKHESPIASDGHHPLRH